MSNPWNLPPQQERSISMLVGQANGCNKKVAEAMGISDRTVEAHLRRAFKKMGVTNRIQAALAWDRWERSQG